MEKIILFNEEEYLEFVTAHDAATHACSTQDKIVFSGKVNKNTKVKQYFVEYEKDKIVQYNFRRPVRVWHSFDELCDTLMIHPTIVKKSLKHSLELVEKLHFKWFSHTQGRPL